MSDAFEKWFFDKRAVNPTVTLKDCWNAATLQARGDVRDLARALEQAIHIIDGNIEPAALGVGGGGETHWFIRDEYLGSFREALKRYLGEV